MPPAWLSRKPYRHFPGANRVQIVADHLVQGILCPGPGELEFAHVADVEDTAWCGMFVLNEYSLVLDRHVETGKGSHLGTVFTMPGSERGYG